MEEMPCVPAVRRKRVVSPVLGAYRKGATSARHDGFCGRRNASGHQGETWRCRHLGKPGADGQLNRVTAAHEVAVWSAGKPLTAKAASQGAMRRTTSTRLALESRSGESRKAEAPRARVV